MVNLRRALIVLTGTLALSSPAFAADYKIGVINADLVLQSAPQFAAMKKKLEQEFASRDKALVEAQKELKGLEDRAQKDGSIMSESERTRTEKDIMKKRRDLKRQYDEFREDVNLRQNEETGKVNAEILKAVQQIAQEQKFDIVLGPGVIFASKTVDMTDQVIQKLKGGGADK
ncbi:MAG: OmpH family outer membrane protein [Gammaproteobacteria bacterium]|nr:OmpH family outer membrane protein [Gammaproteobacteria bacterium]MBI5617293.1 OmpH family outer membrane protein [Gammaproteobacteria bacterium]